MDCIVRQLPYTHAHQVPGCVAASLLILWDARCPCHSHHEPAKRLRVNGALLKCLVGLSIAHLTAGAGVNGASFFNSTQVPDGKWSRSWRPCVSKTVDRKMTGHW